MGWMCYSRLAVFVAALATASCLWFMNHWGMDTPDKSLLPLFPVLLVYSGFFLFGWLLHRQALLIEGFSRLTWDKCALCLLAVIATCLLSRYEMNAAHPQYAVIKAGFMFCYAIMMWLLVALTVGLFKRLFNRPNKVVRYLADSSYWLYLIQLPIVIWFQIAFAELPLHWSIKLVSIVAATVFISIVLYDVFIRSTFIGAMLNGKRKPRFFYTGK
jgi:peptidoglycan/LPS O-acetylase OafA/YrhL